MQNISTTDRLASALASGIIRWRWMVLLATILGVIAAGIGGQYVSLSNNYRVFFSDDNPDLLAFDEFQRTYSKNDNILFVIKPKQGDVFSKQTLAIVEQLTAESWKIPYASRVDSITNFQYSRAEGEDELIVSDLVRDASQLSRTQLGDIQQVAMAEPLLYGFLLAEDAHSTGINVTLQYPEKSLTEVPLSINYAQQLADNIELNHPGITVAITGVSALNNALASSGQADAMSLIPAMYGILLLITLLVLRSISGTLATLLVIAFSTIIAVGITGYAGVALDPISLTATIVILTLAIADSVHILLSVFHKMGQGEDKLSAIRYSIKSNFLAVSITSLTTIIGFLCLNFSDSPPFWHLGNITALGIAAAWLLSLTFLPAFLSVIPVKVSAVPAHKITRMQSFSRWITKHRHSVLLSSIAASILLVSFIPKITLDDSWVTYFDHDIPFRGDAEFAMDNLTGLYLLEYSVASGEEGAVNNPEYLQHLDEFTQWLRARPEVLHVYSYTDIAKRLNKNMHQDTKDWYRLPDTRELAAQYLFLYELSLPFGLDMTDRINISKSASRVTVTLEELSTTQVRAFMEASNRWMESHLPHAMWSTPTGATVMFSRISERNINSMLQGNIIAVLGIAFILMLSLRSAKLGALSLIPNLIPIMMTFGAWGLLVGVVGMGAATVSATSLGIIVDNTVHFLTKYLRARREDNATPEQAVEYAFTTVGSAIIANAFIMLIGFLVLATSSFKVNMEMGLLTAMAIVIALIVDFFLLPTLLMLPEFV
ncbi:MAG: MMPL family transporter [Methylococcales bacterium]|jgi:uncharacterized protein|nr:MMPL family transporter [Methylococcales bacterium]